MKIQPYLLLILFAIILAVNVSSASVSNFNCDQIKQCDAYGVGWDSSANLVCNNANQDNPDTEEVIVTSIRVSGLCDPGDNITDSVDWDINFYEELSSGEIYHGNGHDRFGGITTNCEFGENSVTKYGFINDFNSDRESYIERQWSVIDSSDITYDSCPTDTYNPQDITQTVNLNTFNISFLPLAHEFDQYVEPQFDGATIWNIQDYYLRNATDTYTYSDTIKEYVQDYEGQESWDIYDIFGFAQEQTVKDVLDYDIEYIKDSCTVYEMTGCTNTGSTSFSCTAGTGVNIKTDLQLFFNTFFEKYKTPLIMQLGHTWNYGSTLSTTFSGYYYWETAYGIKDSNVLTYQGMRQYTNRTLSRIQADWTLNNYDAVFVVCEDDADIRVLMSETDDLGSHTYDYDTVLDQYDLIKGEEYYFGVYNDEIDVVTSDSLFRFDWSNDGSWDIDWSDQHETEGLLSTAINTTVSTSELTLDAETWGKGGTDSTLTKYRVYNNPYISFTPDADNVAPISGNINVDVFGTGFYDLGIMDYYCIDYTSDGVYDEVYRLSSFVNYNCTTDAFSIINTDSNLYDNSLDVASSDYLQTPGSYTLTIKGGINLKNSANYTRAVTYPVTWNTPDTTAQITLTSNSWNPYNAESLTFDLSGSTFTNDIFSVCYDYDYSTGYDQCVSKDGTNNCGIAMCIINQNPEDYELGFGFTYNSDFTTHDIYGKAWDIYDFSGFDVQTYQYRAPIIAPIINWLSTYTSVIKTSDITFDTQGSTSENPIVSICMDIDNDNSNEQCESDYETDFTIQYSDVSDFNTHDVSITILDNQGYSEEIIEQFSFRDIYNTAGLRRVSGSVTIGDYINETGWLVFDGANTVSENEHFSCFDYTNDGIYDKCFSNVGVESQCGISCEYNPFVLSADINLSYDVLNEFGDFTLKLLIDNDATQSFDTYDYGIFLDSPDKWYLPKIVSTDNDDDVNDDFIIDTLDQISLTEDIPDDKLWEFEWTSLYSDYLYEPDFSCWGNSITGDFEACYHLGGGYNKFCGINCTDQPWFYQYVVNSSLPYDKNSGYGVTLILGSLDRNVASYTTETFRFNPPVQQDVDVMRSFIIVSITIFVILIFILGILLVTVILVPSVFLGFIFRNFRNKKNKSDDNKE